jgi:pyrroloquinoline quinone biosynthesis protein B
MRVLVLGSSAGGGFPQWNCNCRNCAGLRSARLRARNRTQSSIAISGNGVDWVLVNASPDLLTQVRHAPALQPARASRDTGIQAVILTDAQIDHVTGLLMLRENTRPIELYATASVLEDVSTGFPVTTILSHYCGVRRHAVSVAPPETFQIDAVPGVAFRPIDLVSKAPPYSPHRTRPGVGDNIGLEISDLASGRSVFYAPGLGAVQTSVLAAMQRADCLLVDGTFWTEDEMIAQGLSNKRAAEMGHIPQTGPEGMIALLDTIEKPRKILIHVNNSNPILDEDSAEFETLAAHRIEVAYDGMEITL